MNDFLILMYLFCGLLNLQSIPPIISTFTQLELFKNQKIKITSGQRWDLVTQNGNTHINCCLTYIFQQSSTAHIISRILGLASRWFCGSILKIRCSSHKQSCFRVNAKPPPLSSLVRGFCMSPSPYPKNDTNTMKQNKYNQSIWRSKTNNSSKK